MPSEDRPPSALIRADSTTQLGTGHVMRCLALAQACGDRGGGAEFLSHCTSGALRRRVESSGVKLIPLARPHPDPSDLETTLERLQALAAGRAQRPWLVLDGPHFDPAYHQAVRKSGYPLLVVDDTAHLPSYHADVLLNQNLQAPRLTYHCEPATLLLLGTDYVLLRREFLARAGRGRETPAVARRVLVTLGGSAPLSVMLMVISAMAAAGIEDLEAVVVAGPANPDDEGLQAAARAAPSRIRVARDTSDMPGLMAWADIAIAAGGITCWELAFMGVPTIIGVLAENQRGNAEGLGASGAAVNLGWYEQLTGAQLAREVRSLCLDYRRREALSQASRTLLDGRGSEHLVAMMKTMTGAPPDDDQLALRPAAAGDALPLWRLANDPGVRENSFSPQAIPLDDHLPWYARKLSSPDTRIWVLELARTLVAQVRYDRIDAETAEISFAVVSALRGKGLATAILRRTWALACRELGVARLRGLTLTHNPASGRAFVKAGFASRGVAHLRGRPCHVFARGCTDGGACGPN